MTWVLLAGGHDYNVLALALETQPSVEGFRTFKKDPDLSLE